MKTIKIFGGLALAAIGFIALSSCKNEPTNDTAEVAVNQKVQPVFTEIPTPTANYGYSIGDEATDFKLKDVNGKMVSLSDYKDAKGFIVIFTCNTCPFAVASEERIVGLDKEFKAKGYPVIAINPNNPAVQPDDSYELMQQKAKEAGFTFPYLFDESQTVYAKYGATKTPHVYLLQKEDGKNIVKYIGAIDDNVRNVSEVKDRFLANAVNELLAGKEVSVKETKAIGCSVKQ
ncbi:MULTISPECIES: thioredoxin family protein [Aequorivita]|uniref:Thioredoxin family protein n=1 Tax=Aequorivita iocasae TaxID=2803865 RepID=A0ABX7DVC5_9FLAO|nr:MULTISPECIES: thioredoxin family protein [Aequorivita]QQX77109.1 thioredoxin family protein [Aequorivita iocasae]UCA56594.1 thioredoxin family protein [Aequorivita sp. F7]